MISRRSFLGTILALGAAPAVPALSKSAPTNSIEEWIVENRALEVQALSRMARLAPMEDITMALDEYVRLYGDGFTGSRDGRIYLRGWFIGAEPRA